jgi:hypothetical protein
MEMVDILTWASEDVKTIRCTQDVFDTSFRLKVRKFVPIAGDSLARRWKRHGVARSFECPPYAIANMKEAGSVMSTFLARTLGSAICFYIDETDNLLRGTYEMAYRLSKLAQVSPKLLPT